MSKRNFYFETEGVSIWKNSRNVPHVNKRKPKDHNM